MDGMLYDRVRSNLQGDWNEDSLLIPWPRSSGGLKGDWFESFVHDFLLLFGFIERNCAIYVNYVVLWILYYIVPDTIVVYMARLPHGCGAFVSHLDMKDKALSMRFHLNMLILLGLHRMRQMVRGLQSV